MLERYTPGCMPGVPERSWHHPALTPASLRPCATMAHRVEDLACFFGVAMFAPSTVGTLQYQTTSLELRARWWPLWSPGRGLPGYGAWHRSDGSCDLIPV